MAEDTGALEWPEAVEGVGGTVEGVLSRAVFLTTRPDPIYATVHVPLPRRTESTGVIVCPPFAGEELFTYQTRRVWAQALAQAGHPTLRFDLPSMGDSAGATSDGGRLAAWRGAVADASRWLREEIGCTRVAALGIGFGGMMAWLAATDGAPIDDLMLWGVPTRGRWLMRQVKAAALLDIARNLEPQATGPAETAEPGDGTLLDEAGQVATRETIDALGRIDLTTLELPEPAGRRVLLFERNGVVADEQVRDFFEASGAEVTLADGTSYGAMMRYVEEATVPQAAIAESIDWLARSDGLPGGEVAGTDPAEAEQVRAVTSVEIQHEGATVRETLLTVEVDSIALRGVITEPVETTALGVCAVFFSGGSDRRIGPNRLWVEASRGWAARGVNCVRIDTEGIGDADGDPTYWATPRGHYDKRHVEKTVALLDALQARGLGKRFVLVGFCSGAYRSYQVARVDRRVVGAFAIAFPFFTWTWWTVHIRHSWVRSWRRRPTDPPLKAVTIWGLRTLWRFSEKARLLYVRNLRRHPDKVDRSLQRLHDQGTELLLLYRSNAPAYGDLFTDERMGRIAAAPNAHAAAIPGSDVRFRPLALQSFVREQLDAALERVLAAQGLGAAGAPSLHPRNDVPLPAPAHAGATNGSAYAPLVQAQVLAPEEALASRTLVIARPRRTSNPELRRAIAGGDIPDVVRSDDAIGATHLDDRYFAALPGIRGQLLRSLPLSVAQPLEVLARGRFYDAVLTWSDRPAVILGTLMLAWKRRPAHVAILMWPSKPKKAIPLLLARRGIDRFVACAPLQRRFLLERLRIAPERVVEVKGRRVDVDFWRPRPQVEIDTISSVGQEMRDYSTLVAAIDSLEVPCHIAPGAGIVGASAAKWWRRSLEGRELPANVTVAACTYAELRDLYARSRFVVIPLIPSDNDNGVTTILEAFAMGKAVICTDSPGRAGVIEDGVTGLCVAPGDPIALRKAILELWNDPERCERMGAAAREYVVANHGIDRWTDSLVEAIDGAVAMRAHAGRARVPEGARSTHAANWEA